MNFSLSTYWNYGNEFCSIEHCINADGNIYIYALTALKKNGELDINGTFFSSSVEQAKTKLKKNQHCFLNITGNPVLIKGTSTSGNDKKIIGSAFPNIDIEQFYYQILKTPSQNFVAVSRKDQVHEIIEDYKKNALEVIGISFGFFAIQNLLRLLKEEKLQLGSYDLALAEDQITGYQKSDSLQEEKLYQLDDTEISSNYLLALAGIFSYGILHESLSSNFQGFNAELKTEHRQKVFFRKGLVLGTGVLLISLLINFLLFSRYYEEHQNLTEEYQAELLLKKVYEEKQIKVANKEKLVTNILNNSSSNSTFFLNRLITSKPSSIILSEFTFQPLERQIKDREPIRLMEHQVQISGESADEAEFSLWIRTLEEKTWIKEINVKDFSYKNSQNSQFSLLLILIEDETGN